MIEKLNEVTHSVRAAQAVLQYGVGAMVDFPDQTLVTAAPEVWKRSIRIYDDRLARSLGVRFFEMPTEITYARFPEWYFCPNCRKFQPLKQWIAEYHKAGKTKWAEKDEYMIRHMKCPKCGQDLVVTRIVTVCENGHLDDFPWVTWVHAKAKRKICASPSLEYKTGNSEELDGLKISCSCGASATLRGAFDRGYFEEMDRNFSIGMFKCKGRHPFKNQTERCDCYPRTVQRGASSVYFPLVYRSLVIPPYAGKLYVEIEKSQKFQDCIGIIRDEEPEDRRKKIEKKMDKWSQEIALQIGAKKNEVETVLRDKWLPSTSQEADATDISYRTEEYKALTGIFDQPNGDAGEDFLREETEVSAYHLPHVKSISLINKIRVVSAFVGFSRINPVTSRKDPGYVDIKEAGSESYPAYEVRGEGIFIELEQRDIDEWIRRQGVRERAQVLSDNYAASYIGRGRPRVITPKFILLHTLSHLLISQLSFECGYSVASLSERIYCAEERDGMPMAGIFIYTASGDSEGTLGGLVRQGRPDTFPRILKKAISRAQTCSNDPVCIGSGGQGRESLNLAACHACALLPETCCEEQNIFLDRAMIVGTYEDKEMGFWRDVL